MQRNIFITVKGEVNKVQSLLNQIFDVFFRNKINKGYLVFEFQSNPILVVDAQTIGGAALTVQYNRIISLELSPETMANWETLCTELSKACRDTVISTVVHDGQKMFVNGQMMK